MVSCVHMRTYKCTCTRRVQTTTNPGHTYTDRPRHKHMYTREITNIHYQYTCKLKHPCTLLTRCTVPVAYTEHCTATNTHAHYVRRSDCPCQILYGYKYSVRAQARGSTHNRCTAQAVHAKHCTGTVRTYKHKYSCTLRTPPTLSMPYTVRVQV